MESWEGSTFRRPAFFVPTRQTAGKMWVTRSALTQRILPVSTQAIWNRLGNEDRPGKFDHPGVRLAIRWFRLLFFSGAACHVRWGGAPLPGAFRGVNRWDWVCCNVFTPGTLAGWFWSAFSLGSTKAQWIYPVRSCGPVITLIKFVTAARNPGHMS